MACAVRRAAAGPFCPSYARSNTERPKRGGGGKWRRSVLDAEMPRPRVEPIRPCWDIGFRLPERKKKRKKKGPSRRADGEMRRTIGRGPKIKI